MRLLTNFTVESRVVTWCCSDRTVSKETYCVAYNLTGVWWITFQPQRQFLTAGLQQNFCLIRRMHRTAPQCTPCDHSCWNVTNQKCNKTCGFWTNRTCDRTLTDTFMGHLALVTPKCVSKLTIIGSHNGLLPDRRQAIIWTNAGILLIGTLGTNFSGILIEIHTFPFKKMHLKMSSGKWRPSCLGLDVLTQCNLNNMATILQGTFPKQFFVYGNVIILIQISLMIVPQGPTHNNSNTSSAKGSVLSSNKPLPDPKLTKIYNTI